MRARIPVLLRGFVTLSTLVIIAGCAKVPVTSMQEAWIALCAAESQECAQYAPDLARRTRVLYDSAMQAVAMENDRWFVLRSFARAESLFARTRSCALAAQTLADKERQSRKHDLRLRLEGLHRDLVTLERWQSGHIARIPSRSLLTKASLLHENARQLLVAGELRQATEVADSVETALAALTARLDAANGSARTISENRGLVESTLAWSRATDSAALIVVKTTRRAYLVRAGTLVEEYSVDLGFGSWRQKHHAGDGATPEGVYHVTRWRDRGSRYYKALLLNYPNAEDRERFSRLQREGRLPAGITIGGNIEVHGDGGRGEDWTDGCVALRNEDMDKLLAVMNVGDRVVIVRHLEDWPS